MEFKEIEILKNIYGDELMQKSDGSSQYRVSIDVNEIFSVELDIILDSKYLNKCPVYLINSKTQKLLKTETEKLIIQLNNLYDSESSNNLLKAIEYVRENGNSLFNVEESVNNEKIHVGPALDELKFPKIYQSRIISKRKSRFQAHYATIHSESELFTVLEVVGSQKIADATHPLIYAYNIESVNENTFISGQDDDGEAGASNYLVRLIQSRNLVNGVIIVTRWFGGILLGAERFKLILNIANELLNKVFDVDSKVKLDRIPVCELKILLENIKSKQEDREIYVEYFSHQYNSLKSTKLLNFTSNKNFRYSEINSISENDRILWERKSGEIISK